MQDKPYLLITGASGFLGSSFLRSFLSSPLSKSFKIIAVSRYPVLSADIFLDTSRLLFGDYRSILETLDISVIINFAFSAHNTKYKSSLVHGSTCLITEYFIKYCSLHPHTRFIAISSIAVFGDRLFDASFVSNISPVSPNTNYGLQKLFIESMLLNAHSLYSFPLSIYRPPLIYGPNAPGSYDTLRRLIRKGIPLCIFSNSNLRSFLPINSFVATLLNEITSDKCLNVTNLPYPPVSTYRFVSDIKHDLMLPFRNCDSPILKENNFIYRTVLFKSLTSKFNSSYIVTC